jgi:hypothetical protein
MRRTKHGHETAPIAGGASRVSNQSTFIHFSCDTPTSPTTNPPTHDIELLQGSCDDVASMNETTALAPGFFRYASKARSEPNVIHSKSRLISSSSLWTRFSRRRSDTLFRSPSKTALSVHKIEVTERTEGGFISGRARLGNVVDDQSVTFSLLLALESSIYQVRYVKMATLGDDILFCDTVTL